VDAFEALYELYIPTVFCLEEITNSSGCEWNRETSKFISKSSDRIQIYNYSCCHKKCIVFFYTKGLNVKLQGKWQDIARAYKDIKLVKESLGGCIDTQTV